ncbi:hypothetical protein ACMFMG_007074 [Clarireedia jacksonii]
MSPKESRKLSPLTTSWHNRSRSTHQQPTPIELQHQSPKINSPDSFSHEPRPFKMDRQDSGYAENITSIPSHMRASPRSPSTSSCKARPSLTAARRSSSQSKRSSAPPSTSSSSGGRSTTKRPSKSRTSTSSQSRSHLSSRQHQSQTQPQQPYQYFHFPSLADDFTSDASPPPPPPATIHYWTSDQTRRLEYAAIDAASKGIRGLITRCIPDCFLPLESRRRKFCKKDTDDVDDDAGSVRRYRLVMAEEGSDEKTVKVEKDKKKEPAHGHRRRWSAPWRW